MSKERLDFILQLIPISTKSSGTVAKEQLNPDAWLTNSDADLLELEGLTELNSLDAAGESGSPQSTQNITLEDLLKQLSKDQNRTVYKVDRLSIVPAKRGYLLLLDDEKRALLHGGDFILLSDSLLKVEIVEEHVVENSAESVEDPLSSSNKEFHDIWSSPKDQHTAGNRYADPFFQAASGAALTNRASQSEKKVVQTAYTNFNSPRVSQAASPFQDPLDFLYDSRGSRQIDENRLLAGERVSDSEYSSEGLTVNTQNRYRPVGESRMTQSYDDAIPAVKEPVIPRMASDSLSLNEGNVLNDLGIDESRSTIAQREYQSGKSSFQEQSPMDILDEYLDDGQTMQYTANHSYPNPPNKPSVYLPLSEHPDSFSIANAYKKIVKVFSE